MELNGKLTKDYSAVYFNRAAEILVNRDTPVTMQVFQKRENAVLCGIWEVIDLLKNNVWKLGDEDSTTEVWALDDGDVVQPWEPVMVIKGDLYDFVHLESVYLGILARGTKVATNTRRVVEAANGKPVLFFADRFDRYENQRSDGYAATLGGAADVCTWEMVRGAAELSFGKRPVGTMPHALIAAFGGDVVEASKAFRKTFPEVPLTALVDFNNDCVGDSLRCLEAMGKDLYAVRLDTSEKMVDVSLRQYTKNLEWKDDRELYGVNRTLVNAVRHALDEAGGQHVKIAVSGGFSESKIRLFENSNTPVDIYAVGSSLLQGSNDFTADVVEPVAKRGRSLQDTSRLKRIF